MYLKYLRCAIYLETYTLKIYIFFIKERFNNIRIVHLYSSNWTEMDMKCKKLILLTMKMNNANQKKLKFIQTKIVNLEMFFKVNTKIITILPIL